MSTFAHKIMNSGIEAVVFDFGGVLSLPPLDEHIEHLRNLCGLDHPTFERNYRLRRGDYDRGSIDSRQYWSRVADSKGKGLDAGTHQALFEGDAASWTRINLPVLEWAGRLRRAGVRTGILSNMPRDVLHWIGERFPWIAEFEVRVFSCDLGVNKPDEKIYRSCLGAFRLEGEQVLFLDDIPKNVKGAEQVGIRAVLFHDLNDTLKVIEKHGWLPVKLTAEQE